MTGQLKGLTAIFFAACIWGMSGPYFRWVDANGIGIFLNNLVACTSAALAIAAIGTFKNLPFLRIRRRHLLVMIPHAFGSIVTSYTMYYAFSLTTVANTVLLHYLTPIFVAVISVPLFGERLTWLKVSALLVSMFGMTLVISSRSSGLAITVGKGELLAFISSLSYTVSILAGRYLKDLQPITTAFYNNVLVALISAVLLSFSTPVIFPGVMKVGVVAVLGGLVGSVLALMLYFFALRHSDASKVSIVALTEVAVGSFLGVILFNERLTSQIILGGALIMGGCVIVAGEKGER